MNSDWEALRSRTPTNTYEAGCVDNALYSKSCKFTGILTGTWGRFNYCNTNSLRTPPYCDYNLLPNRPMMRAYACALT